MVIGFWLPERTFFGIQKEYYAFVGAVSIVPILILTIVYLIYNPVEDMSRKVRRVT